MSFWVYLPWFFSIFAMVSMTVAAADQSPAEPDQDKLLRIRICRCLSPDSNPKIYFNWVELHFYWLSLLSRRRKTDFENVHTMRFIKGQKGLTKIQVSHTQKLQFSTTFSLENVDIWYDWIDIDFDIGGGRQRERANKNSSLKNSKITFFQRHLA